MQYPEVSITICDHLNPECGYQMRITNGRTGKTILFTGKSPITGLPLLTYDDCLKVAATYATNPGDTRTEGEFAESLYHKEDTK